MLTFKNLIWFGFCDCVVSFRFFADRQISLNVKAYEKHMSLSSANQTVYMQTDIIWNAILIVDHDPAVIGVKLFDPDGCLLCAFGSFIMPNNDFNWAQSVFLLLAEGVVYVFLFPIISPAAQ